MHKADVASALLHQSIPLWLWWTRRHSCILQTHRHNWAVPSQTTKNTENYGGVLHSLEEKKIYSVFLN